MICVKCGKEIPEGSIFCNHCGRKQQRSERKQRPKARGNGQGTVIKNANGHYKAIVTLGYYLGSDGKLKRKTKTKTFVKKSDAVAALPTLRAETAVKDINLHELMGIYTHGKDYAALSSSQQDKMGYAWKRLAPLEFRGIGTLTVDDMQNVIDAATNTFYPARDCKVLLSHLYHIAIRKEIVSVNKTEFIELPEQPKAKRENWTHDEVARMWADYNAGNRFTGYMLIMCYCGLRYGEITTLKVENIDLKRRVMIGGIKTEAGTDREIPIARAIAPVIEERLTDAKNGKLLAINDDHFYGKYWEMVDRLGLRRLPPHTCRHWYFSTLTAAGAQGGLIAETGGHASFVTTMQNYVRIPLEDKLKTVDLLDGQLKEAIGEAIE